MEEETRKEGDRECVVSKPEIAATFAFSNMSVNGLLSILHERLMRRISKSVEMELSSFGAVICCAVGDEMDGAADASLRKAQKMSNAMMTAANAAKDEVNKMKAKMGK